MHILQIFHDLGSRSARRNQVRFRFLVESLGPERILPEIEQRVGFSLTRFPTPPPPPEQLESFIGWFPQRQPDLWAVGVAVPMGRLTWQQLDGVATLSANYGDGTIRTTTDQNLVLPGLRTARSGCFRRGIRRLGLAFEADSLDASDRRLHRQTILQPGPDRGQRLRVPIDRGTAPPPTRVVRDQNCRQRMRQLVRPAPYGRYRSARHQSPHRSAGPRRLRYLSRRRNWQVDHARGSLPEGRSPQAASRHARTYRARVSSPPAGRRNVQLILAAHLGRSAARNRSARGSSDLALHELRVRSRRPGAPWLLPPLCRRQTPVLIE